MGQCCSFVEFESHEHALAALRELNNNSACVQWHGSIAALHKWQLPNQPPFRTSIPQSEPQRIDYRRTAEAPPYAIPPQDAAVRLATQHAGTTQARYRRQAARCRAQRSSAGMRRRWAGV
jgi:hypothetical protein